MICCSQTFAHFAFLYPGLYTHYSLLSATPCCTQDCLCCSLLSQCLYMYMLVHAAYTCYFYMLVHEGLYMLLVHACTCRLVHMLLVHACTCTSRLVHACTCRLVHATLCCSKVGGAQLCFAVPSPVHTTLHSARPAPRYSLLYPGLYPLLLGSQGLPGQRHRQHVELESPHQVNDFYQSLKDYVG
jgi:hypothetical protein